MKALNAFAKNLPHQSSGQEKLPYLVLIGGGTASGKSNIADCLLQNIPQSSVLPLDRYFYPQQQPREFFVNGHPNYDHPSALDWTLMRDHIRLIKSEPSKKFETPSYDHLTCDRSSRTLSYHPAEICIVEGIHAFYDPEICALADLKVYVDYPDDLRLIRRMKRDLLFRGETLESTMQLYLDSVRAMHEAFVEPSQKEANLKVSGENARSAAAVIGARILSDRLLQKLLRTNKVKEKRIIVDGNDGTGKTTLVKGLRSLGLEATDRGIPTKMTDDSNLSPSPDECYLILDVPVEVSRERLKAAGKDLNEKYHTVDDLTYYRKRFLEVKEKLPNSILLSAVEAPEVLLFKSVKALEMELN